MAGNVLPVANTIQLWPNKRLVSNLYQDDTNMRESAYRTLNRQNYSVSFGPTVMGATAQNLNFNKDSIVNHVLVEFELPSLAADKMSAGRGLPVGWAWSLCRRIVMQYSGSNALEIQGRDNFIRALAEADTREKRNQLIKLGGNAIYKSSPTKIEGADPDGKFRGAILVYLPHSSVSGQKQIGYDCSQANSAPIIRMDLASAEDVWTDLTITGDNAALADITFEMRQVAGKFYVGETAMIDSINSRRDRVGPMGNAQSLFFFAYPNYWSQAVKVNPQVRPVDNTLVKSEQYASNQMEVTLNGFLNGSIQYLIVYCERTGGFADSQGAVANNGADVQRPKRAPLKYVKLTNIKITYGGGNTIYEAPTERIGQLVDLVNNPVDSSYDLTVLNRSGVTDTVTVVPGDVKGYFYRIQIAQFSELYKMFSLLQTGANLGSDTLKLTATVVDNLYQDGTAQIDYQLNVQQIYQVSMTTARGNIKWDFVNPTPQALPAQLSIST